MGRQLDPEIEHICPVLVRKAGDVSVAGRENFLVELAASALKEMVTCCSETRSAAALVACSSHSSKYVRAKVLPNMSPSPGSAVPFCLAVLPLGSSVAAGHKGTSCILLARDAPSPRQTVYLQVASALDELLRGSSPPPSSGTTERCFNAAVGFLEEAAPDTRTYGKRMLWAIYNRSPAEFESLLRKVIDFALEAASCNAVNGPITNGPDASWPLDGCSTNVGVLRSVDSLPCPFS